MMIPTTQISETTTAPSTRPINPWTWQAQFGYSQAVETRAKQHVLYCAGQTAMSDEGIPLHVGDMGAQIRRAMDNLETVLRTADYGVADVTRLTVYTTDVDLLFAHYGELVGRLPGPTRPAITLLGVERLAFPELLVEIEATAAK